jgi:hypothetical protein
LPKFRALTFDPARLWQSSAQLSQCDAKPGYDRRERRHARNRFNSAIIGEETIMRHFAIPLFLSAAMLAACSAEAPPADSQGTNTADEPVPTDAAAPADKAAPSTDNRALPLKVGRYVIRDTPCKDAANAAIRMFDGKGLSGSATKDCKANITRRDGNRYTVDQSCVDTYNGKRASEAQVIVVDAPDAFTLVVRGKSTAYQYCAAEG